MKFSDYRILIIAGLMMFLLFTCENDVTNSFRDDQRCEPESYEEMFHVPLDMFFVLDITSSMAGTWDSIVNLLTTFFQQPASKGINIAISFMPNPDAAGNICDPNDYNPPQIPSPAPPLATLPDNFTVLNTALSGVSLAGSETPMYGALDGTYQFAGPYLASNPTHKVVVIFVADGLPSGGSCNTYYGGSDYEDISTIAALAADALSYYGLPTYTVALDGSALVPCDAIAAAGGTSEAYDVTADTNLFLDVMEEIRWDNYGSRYIAPDPDQVDLSNINIVYTFGGIGDPETIPQADSLADCGVIIPNWYFDDPGNPTSILLCPNCRFTIEQDSNPLLQLAKGCPTVTNY